MPAGLYSLANLAAAALGLVMTSPLGPLSFPPEVALDVSTSARPGYAIQLHAKGGSKLGVISSPRPVPLDLAQLPDSFIDAVIAAEDERFLEHSGIDPIGVVGALADTMRGRTRGGSTITQQMVKNTRVGNERTMGRKVVEALLAVRAQHRLGRREVLRRYLQSAWYGRGITGVVQAPMVWFGKGWQDITLAEAATLAAMLKGPSFYDPWKNPETTKRRRDSILANMERLGWISPQDLKHAQAEPVRAIAPDIDTSQTRWLRGAAARDLDEFGAVLAAGVAQSTIDPVWQGLAEVALADAVRQVSPVKAPRNVPDERLQGLINQEGELHLPEDLRAQLPAGTHYNSALLLDHDADGWDILVAGAGLLEDVQLSDPHPSYDPSIGDLVPVLRLEDKDGVPVFGIRLPTLVEGAVVILDPRSGEILASVGGVDAGLTEFDRTRAHRQPGSAIKPFLYLAALGEGFSPTTTVEDIERTWITRHGVAWRPRNYDLSQAGRIPMYSGLERSSNLAAAFLIDRIGVEAMAERAEAAGVYPAGKMVRHISAALGTSETTLRDLVSGYAAIVNDGMPRRPHAVMNLRNADGLRLPEDYRRPGPIAGRGEISDLLGMLRGVVVRGTASSAFKDHPVRIAGKTGTTQDWRDAWFVGVTPQIAIGVWLGRDDNGPLPNHMAGGTAAAPIAARILREAHELDLIDTSGMRDDTMSSSLEWPPMIHGGHSTAAPPRAAAARPQPRRNKPAAETGISGFWAGVEVQKVENPDVNRNGDLLEMLR